MKKIVSFKVDNKLYTIFKNLAKAQGKTVSEFIRDLVIENLGKNNHDFALQEIQEEALKELLKELRFLKKLLIQIRKQIKNLERNKNQTFNVQQNGNLKQKKFTKEILIEKLKLFLLFIQTVLNIRIG